MLAAIDARMGEVYWGAFVADAAGLMRADGEEWVDGDDVVAGGATNGRWDRRLLGMKQAQGRDDRGAENQKTDACMNAHGSSTENQQIDRLIVAKSRLAQWDLWRRSL